MTGCRTADADRRVAVDAPVVRRTLNEVPLIVLALDLDHRDAFAGLSLVHIFERLRLAAVGEQVAVVGVFVVDRHQCAVVVAGEREQAHAVIVVAELDFLGLGGAVAARVEGRTDQHRTGVAGWQAQAVAGGGGDAVEAQQLAGRCAGAGGHHAAGQQVAAEEQCRAAQGTRADEAAAAEADHLLEVGGLVFF